MNREDLSKIYCGLISSFIDIILHLKQRLATESIYTHEVGNGLSSGYIELEAVLQFNVSKKVDQSFTIKNRIPLGSCDGYVQTIVLYMAYRDILKNIVLRTNIVDKTGSLLYYDQIISILDFYWE